MSTPGAAGGRRRNRGSAALVVEADDAYRAVIETCVGLAGCRAETVADLAGAVPRLAGERFDVLVWGTGPDDDGLADAVSRLRASTEAQLVLLTDHFEAVQPAGGTGADHVLPKPFVPSALVGALQAAMRR